MSRDMEYNRAVLAVNQAELDKELYFEAVRVLSKKRRYLVLMATGLLLVPVCILMGSKMAAIFSLLIAVIAAVYRPLVGWRDYRKLRRRYQNDRWSKTISFYPDSIEIISSGGDQRVETYDRVNAIRSTEHLYVLDFGKKAPSTILTKDGFVRGSIEDVNAALARHIRAEADRRANAETG